MNYDLLGNKEFERRLEDDDYSNLTEEEKPLFMEYIKLRIMSKHRPEEE